ncbi:MAG: zinc transporter ZupT [Peptococcaceae bacterium]
MTETNIIYAFGLTLLAGLATGIGSALTIFTKKTNTKVLSVALGFSAGVMIYVSMIEIFFKGKAALVSQLGPQKGSWLTVAAFFGGMLVIAVIDKLIPQAGNPHEMRSVEEMGQENNDQNKLLRMGFVTALAITVHNFPEGLATFAAAVKDPALGLPIAFAIAIHNIPEGIAVAIPVYYATGSRRKAFIYSFISGLSEPLGALIGYFLLASLFNDLTFGLLFALVAGIMVFISLDELLPAAEEYGEHHLSIYGVISGMLVMAVSLLLFI